MEDSNTSQTYSTSKIVRERLVDTTSSGVYVASGLKLVQSKKNEFSIMLVATDEALLQKSFSHIGLSKPWKDDCTKPAAVLRTCV